MSIIKVKNNGAWQEVAGMSKHTHTTEDITNFPSSLPANGGNADTLDGKHASDFATASGLADVRSDVSNAITEIASDGANLTYTKCDGSTENVQLRNGWTKVQDVTVESEVGYLFYSTDSNGVELKTKNYTKAYLFIQSAAQTTASSGELMAYVNVYRAEHDSRPRASAGNNFIKNTTSQFWKALFDIDNGLCLFGVQGISNESWSDTINSTPDSYQLFTRPASDLYTNEGFINNIKIKSNVNIPAGTKIKIWMR